MTDWEPATEAEVAMRDALRAENQEGYFRVLARCELLLPTSAEAQAGRTSTGWGTWTMGGRTHVLAFTSEAALRACLADSAGSARRIDYHELAAAWPNVDWWLAVNPGLPIEGYLPAWFVSQLARGDVRLPGRTMAAGARIGAAVGRARVAAVAPGRIPGESAASVSDGGQTASPVSGGQTVHSNGAQTASPVSGGQTVHSNGAQTASPASGGQTQPTPASPPASPHQPAPAGVATGSLPSRGGSLPRRPRPGGTSVGGGAPAVAAPQQADALTEVTPARPAVTPAPAPAAAVPAPAPAAVTPAAVTPAAVTPAPVPAEAAPVRPAPAPAAMTPATVRPAPASATPSAERAVSAVPASPLPRRDVPPEPAQPDFTPANDVETGLLAAASEGSTDSFLSTLLLAKVLVPVPVGSSPSARPGDGDFTWRTEMLDGETYVAVFTSTERLADHLAEPVETVAVKFAQLIRHWPDPRWSFTVNPGTPVGAKLPGNQIVALATWAAEVGLGDDVDTDEAEPRETTAAPADVRPQADRPVREAHDPPMVMQKTIAPEQVSYYLERAYDRVSGFVHRASELAHVKTPGDLFAALGLSYPDSPFSADAEAVHVLRWTVYRPNLYRIAYGGQHEAAMQAMQGWVIERGPFRGNGFAPSENGDIVAEFKVDSVRLPHGAELWRIAADGTQKLVAVLDSDVPAWRVEEEG